MSEMLTIFPPRTDRDFLLHLAADMEGDRGALRWAGTDWADLDRLRAIAERQGQRITKPKAKTGGIAR